jgi:Fe-S cluster biogenesis protein NfuA
MTTRTDEEIIEQIKKLIETQVKPNVATHGGNIEFLQYDNGKLLLELGGACSGCAGSTMTLKMGVENMIKHYVPEVHTVDAQDDPFSNVDPYYMHDPFMENFDMYEDDNESDT